MTDDNTISLDQLTNMGYTELHALLWQGHFSNTIFALFVHVIEWLPANCAIWEYGITE